MQRLIDDATGGQGGQSGSGARPPGEADRAVGDNTGEPVVGGPLPAELPTEQVASLAEAYLDALVAELRLDRDRFGLRRAVTAHALRFVAILAELREEPWGQQPDRIDLDDPDGPDKLLVSIVERVCIDEPGHINAVIRPGIVSTVTRLAKSPAVRQRARRGETLLDDALLCFLYRTFFADAITEFLTSVIAAKLNVAVPVLLMIDPTGQISQYLAGRVVDTIPTPCEEKAEKKADEPVVSIARGMVGDTFDQWLDSSAEAA